MEIYFIREIHHVVQEKYSLTVQNYMMEHKGVS